MFDATMTVRMDNSAIRCALTNRAVILATTDFNHSFAYKINPDLTDEARQFYLDNFRKITASGLLFESSPSSHSPFHVDEILGIVEWVKLDNFKSSSFLGPFLDFSLFGHNPLAGAYIRGVYVRGESQVLRRNLYGVVVTEYSLPISADARLYRNMLSGDINVFPIAEEKDKYETPTALQYKCLGNFSSPLTLSKNFGRSAVQYEVRDPRIRRTKEDILAGILRTVFRDQLGVLTNSVHPEKVGIAVSSNFPPCLLLNRPLMQLESDKFKVSVAPETVGLTLNKMATLVSGFSNQGAKILCTNGDLILTVKDSISASLLELGLEKKVDGRGKIRVTLTEAQEFSECFKNPSEVYDYAQCHLDYKEFMSNLSTRQEAMPIAAIITTECSFDGVSIPLLFR